MAEFERAFSWDDEIEKESEFTLLPEGDYDFTVESMERGQFNGSDKMPPCPMAILNVRVSGKEGATTIKHNLFLHTRSEWALSAFFKSIGQKKSGEKMRMNWQLVPGSHGRCHVKVRQYIGNDGQQRETNQIQRFLEPNEAPAQNKMTW